MGITFCDSYRLNGILEGFEFYKKDTLVCLNNTIEQPDPVFNNITINIKKYQDDIDIYFLSRSY